MTAVLPPRPTAGRAVDRPVRVRPGRPDLPDLGADLRLQPGVRALPVLLGTARSARADHRRGRGGHRRAAADAGVLRQRRRRGADRPAGLLAPAGLRRRPRRRRQVLHQRHQAGHRTAPSSWPRTDYVDVQISLDGATAEVNDAVRGTGSFATATRALENLAEAGMKDFKISVVVTRRERRAARRVQGARRPLRRPAADHPVAPVGPRRRRVGPAAPHPGPAARAVRLAAGQRRERAHRRLVLPPRPRWARRCPG